MSDILAIPMMLGGALATVLTAYSQQIISIDACSQSGSLYATRTTTNSLNDINHSRNNFAFGLPKNAVPCMHTASTFGNYLGTSASRDTSFFGVQLRDLNSNRAIDFKNTIIVASHYIAYYSLTLAHTPAIDLGKINFKDITLFAGYCIIYWSA